MERLLNAEQSAEEELETLALEGLNSGEPIAVDAAYWEIKHRQLDERPKDDRHTVNDSRYLIDYYATEANSGVGHRFLLAS